MDAEKLTRAQQLEDEAKALMEQAFNERPLPDRWRVGQKVRVLVDKEWCCSAGAIMVVAEIRPEYSETPSHEYQVFYTAFDGDRGRYGRYWTTPDEVELVEDFQP